jgi:hypothetical protein
MVSLEVVEALKTPHPSMLEAGTGDGDLGEGGGEASAVSRGKNVGVQGEGHGDSVEIDGGEENRGRWSH